MEGVQVSHKVDGLEEVIVPSALTIDAACPAGGKPLVAHVQGRKG